MLCLLFLQVLAISNHIRNDFADKKLLNFQSDDQSLNIPTDIPTVSPTRPPQEKRKVLALIIGVLFLVAFFMFIIIFFMCNRDKGQINPSTSRLLADSESLNLSHVQ